MGLSALPGAIYMYMTIHAFSGFEVKKDATYRLAITVEDFPHGLIDVKGENFTRSRPLSRIPL